MAKRKAKVKATPEMVARAKKLKGEGKSYKEIADVLHLGYDKAAWNLLNSGPTGKHRGAGQAGKEAPKGQRKAAPAKVADKGVVAKRTGRKSGKKAPSTPAAAAHESDKAKAEEIDRAREESPQNVPGGMAKPSGRPVARPKEEARAVPKSEQGRKLDRKPKGKERPARTTTRAE